ncbi:MAG: hypothetical protein IPO21_18900 [Bacteroidales bacterium]|nr:hypothetical protein [Bacteroidales bacterium]
MLIVFLALFVFSSVHADENDNYIEREISNINKLLENAKFVKGVLFIDNDSVETNILVFKGTHKLNNSLFCVCKMNNNSIKIYRAKEIEGYKFDGKYYKKHISGETHFFILKISSGKIDLYERNDIPSDKRFLYYLKLPSSDNLFVISPFDKNITEYKVSDKSANSTTSVYVSKGIDQNSKCLSLNILVTVKV